MKITKYSVSKNRFILVILFLSITMPYYAQNPIVPNQGLNDPHIHIFNDTDGCWPKRWSILLVLF